MLVGSNAVSAADGPLREQAAPYTITASAGPGGSISPSGEVIDRRREHRPDLHHHAGPRLPRRSTCSSTAVSVGAVTSYTFSPVTASHTISVSFAIDSYTITASVVGGNGGISPSGSVPVNHGASQTFTITPAANYHVADVLVDGSLRGRGRSSYTFTNVAADHTISRQLRDRHATRSRPASSAATAASRRAASVPVNYGASQTFTITPAANYHVADVLVDGSLRGRGHRATPSPT